MHDVQPLAIPNTNQSTRSTMTQVNIEVGKVSDLLYDLMTSTKAKKFREIMLGGRQ